MAERAWRIPHEPTPFPLGRHVQHDQRSFNFRAVSEPASPRPVLWRRWGPQLHQGEIGACTYFSVLGCLHSVPLYRKGQRFTNEDGWNGYSRATEIDPFHGTWRPDDTGSSGLAACQVARERGLISGYFWCFGLAEVLAALNDSPVMVGTNWRRDMSWPGSDGMLRVSGDIVGGHEYVLNGNDVRRRRVRILNSWGRGWGLGGMAWLAWDDLGMLLDQQGDAIVPRR